MARSAVSLSAARTANPARQSATTAMTSTAAVTSHASYRVRHARMRHHPAFLRAVITETGLKPCATDATVAGLKSCATDSAGLKSCATARLSGTTLVAQDFSPAKVSTQSYTSETDSNTNPNSSGSVI